MYNTMPCSCRVVDLYYFAHSHCHCHGHRHSHNHSHYRCRCARCHNHSRYDSLRPVGSAHRTAIPLLSPAPRHHITTSPRKGLQRLMLVFLEGSLPLQYHVKRIPILTREPEATAVPEVLARLEGDLDGHGVEGV